MREIKFRAWLKEIKQMGYPSHLKVGNPEGVFEITVPFDESLRTFRKLYSTDEFELMQYTGLKDKNGVEIYEGDIIQGIDKDKVGVVYFENGSFKIKWKYIDKEHFFLREQANDGIDYFGVIGNIYQNPELIK